MDETCTEQFVGSRLPSPWWSSVAAPAMGRTDPTACGCAEPQRRRRTVRCRVGGSPAGRRSPADARARPRRTRHRRRSATSADDTIAAVTAVLGEPDEDSGWVDPLTIGACAGDAGSLRGVGIAVPLLLRRVRVRPTASGTSSATRTAASATSRRSRRAWPPRGHRPRHDRRLPARGVPRRRRRGR